MIGFYCAAVYWGLDVSQWLIRLTTIEGGTKSPVQYFFMAAFAINFLNVEASNLDAAAKKFSMEKVFFLAVVVGTAISMSLNSVTAT